MEVRWAKLKSAELRALQQRNAVVVVPIGALEQHGPHLPVETDVTLVGTIAERACHIAAEEAPVVMTPVVWASLSEHHMPFGGTITLDFPTFHGVLRCVCRSLVRQGFRRIFLLNGHGGNIAALNVIVGELTQEFDVGIATGTYWTVAGSAFLGVLERQDRMGHACEAETSMMMALAPELVDREQLPGARGAQHVDEVRDIKERVYRWHTFRHWTESGVAGDATGASAEKGERLLSTAAEALAEVLTHAGLWEMDI